MATIRLVLDTRRPKESGVYPIKIKISNRAESYYYSTGIDATPDQFKDGQLKGIPNHASKNAYLRRMLTEIEELVLPNLHRIKEVLNRYKGKGDTFIDYMDKFISLKSNTGTKSVYTQTKVKIVEYDNSCTFNTMDVTWLKRFELHMINQGIGVNARGIHLRNIRAIFNYAIDEEITSLYPFRKFKIKKEETRKKALTIEQLITLKNYACEPHQTISRDMFMLMFYLIGINPVDLFNLKELRNGRAEYHRAKTGKLYSIEVTPKAKDIIDKYKGNKYVVNVLDNWKDYRDFSHRMNINLKEIGPFARKGRGGSKVRRPLFPDITIYHARHTWATIAAELDIPKETIAAALGHSSSSVTDIYIKFNPKKIDEANRMVLHYLDVKSLLIVIEKLFGC
ncbi:phage integrase SAM-like domain-containing protein [Bacteroides sp.]|uniref:phage integrase SAM-like domain-containing protein n=1 Tax=Bacteroides sp. TaxID=29523 RepID=UPI003D0F2484